MKRGFVALLTAVLLLISLVPAAALAQGVPGDGAAGAAQTAAGEAQTAAPGDEGGGQTTGAPGEVAGSNTPPTEEGDGQAAGEAAGPDTLQTDAPPTDEAVSAQAAIPPQAPVVARVSTFNDLVAQVSNASNNPDGGTIAIDTTAFDYTNRAQILINNVAGGTVTITSAGGGAYTRQPGMTDPLFYVTTGNVRFENITLDGGRGSSLTGSDSLVVNQGGGLSTVTLGSGAVLQNNTGTVAAFQNGAGSTATIESGVTFQKNENTSGDGGAVYNAGTLNVTDCKFWDNSATGNGAGIYNTGSLSIADSWFEQNSADGSGGAVYSTGAAALTMMQPVFYNNTAGASGGGVYNVGTGAFTLNDCYFSYNTAAMSGGAVYNASADLSLIDGSYLYSTAGTGDGGGVYNGSGALSVLRGAYGYNEAKNGRGGAIYSGSGTVEATGAAFEVNKAKNGGAIYNWGSAADIANCSFTTNKAGESGGAIVNANLGVLTVAGCSFTGNVADTLGGAIFHSGVSASISGGNIFTDNEAEIHGGAIYHTGGSLHIAAGTFTGNTAVAGGAVYADGTTTIDGTAFAKNSAADGGAVYNRSGTATVINTTFKENTASFGGAIHNSALADVRGSMFTGNEAGNCGGAIYNESTGTLLIGGGATFTGNAADEGGALYNEQEVSLYSVTLSGNSARAGQDLYAFRNSKNELDGSIHIDGAVLEAGAYFSLVMGGSLTADSSIGIETLDPNSPVAAMGMRRGYIHNFTFSDAVLALGAPIEAGTFSAPGDYSTMSSDVNIGIANVPTLEATPAIRNTTRSRYMTFKFTSPLPAADGFTARFANADATRAGAWMYPDSGAGDGYKYDRAAGIVSFSPEFLARRTVPLSDGTYELEFYVALSANSYVIFRAPFYLTNSPITVSSFTATPAVLEHTGGTVIARATGANLDDFAMITLWNVDADPSKQAVLEAKGAIGDGNARGAAFTLPANTTDAAQAYLLRLSLDGARADDDQIVQVAVGVDHALISGPGEITQRGQDGVWTFKGAFDRLGSVEVDYNGTTYPLTFTKASGSLVNLSLNGVVVGKAEPGSAKITLHASYLDTLSNGQIVVRALFDDGYGVTGVGEARVSLNRAAVPSGTTPTDAGQSTGASPATGDHANLGLWIALCTAAGAALVYVLEKRRRKTVK